MSLGTVFRSLGRINELDQLIDRFKENLSVSFAQYTCKALAKIVADRSSRRRGWQLNDLQYFLLYRKLKSCSSITVQA